jgi:hypothetical protein
VIGYVRLQLFTKEYWATLVLCYDCRVWNRTSNYSTPPPSASFKDMCLKTYTLAWLWLLHLRLEKTT